MINGTVQSLKPLLEELFLDSEAFKERVIEKLGRQLSANQVIYILFNLFIECSTQEALHVHLREPLPGDDDNVQEPGYIPPQKYLGCNVPQSLTENDEKCFKVAVNSCFGPLFNVSAKFLTYMTLPLIHRHQIACGIATAIQHGILCNQIRQQWRTCAPMCSSKTQPGLNWLR